MSKAKHTNQVKNKIQVTQSKQQTVSQQDSPQTVKKFPWVWMIILAALAVLLNKNTFHHRFVLDDHGIIKNNKITKAPVSWENTQTIFSTSLRKGDFSDLENSLYRPFTKLVFNIEWNLFDGDAGAFHVVNVVLYALAGMLIFIILYDINQKKWFLPFLISLLYVVHPIHVEVVANIKSADEILSLIGILLALRSIQLYFNKQQIFWIGIGIVGFLIGSFSKESTVVAAAIFPIFIYFFTPASIKKNIMLSALFLSCSIFFLFARYATLSQYPPNAKTSALDNYLVLCNPTEQKFLSPDLQEKYKGSSQFASAVNTLGDYIKKFVYPHPLSCDYSFSTFEPVSYSHPGFLISFIFFAGIFGWAVYTWKQKSLLSFGILWFFIAISITSNVFMLIGTSFGDRLLFVPSLGLCIAFVAALTHIGKKTTELANASVWATIKQSPIVSLVVILMAIGYSAKTIARNMDWETDYQLFSTDVKNYPNATHLLFYMGNHLSSTERKEVLTYLLSPKGYTAQQINDSSLQESVQSIMYLSKALSIYPALPSDGYNQLGKAYYNIGKIDSAQKYYQRAFEEDSTNGIFINNLGTVYYVSGQDEVRRGRIYQSANRIDSAQYLFNQGLQHILYSLQYFKKAHTKDTTEADFLNNIGCVYGDTQRPDSAIFWFAKAHQADSLDITSLQYLDLTYRNMGKIQEADYYKAKMEQVKMLRQQSLMP